MKTKLLSFVISGLMMTAMMSNMTAIAAEQDISGTTSVEVTENDRAAGLIVGSVLSFDSGYKTVYITAEVYGSAIMSKIGFKNIKIQKSSDLNNWTTEKTVSDQLAEDAVQKKLSSYAVAVNGGYYYRVVLDNYAKENTWWFPETQTLTSTSNSVWVS